MIGANAAERRALVLANPAMDARHTTDGVLAAVQLISRLGVQAKTAAPVIAPLLKDPDPATRVAAAEAIWEITDDVPLVFAALFGMSLDANAR